MLSFLTVNIGAASRDWAESLLTWLAKQSGDVFLLTETSAGPGTDYLLTRFRDAGYAVVHTPDSNGDRGTDPVAGLVRQISHGGPGPGVDEFLLVGREERFGYGVIVADPGASEGPSDLVLLAVGIEGCAPNWSPPPSIWPSRTATRRRFAMAISRAAVTSSVRRVASAPSGYGV